MQGHAGPLEYTSDHSLSGWVAAELEERKKKRARLDAQSKLSFQEEEEEEEEEAGDAADGSGHPQVNSSNCGYECARSRHCPS